MFKKIRQIHFVGIGGSGMSGIAEVLLKLGYRVTGSDISRNPTSERLQKIGAAVHVGHKAKNIEGADVVVTSTAIGKTNDEVKEAHKRGIPVIPRIEMLAEIARLKYTVAVAGTHGKTTTTSLVGQILKHGGLDPTVVVGGRLRAVGTGGVLGAGDYLVAEADESDGSFLKLSPTVGIVTNVDDDHLDYYKTMARLEDAFVQFASHIPFYGKVFLCGDDGGVRKILKRLTRRFAVYGFSPKHAIFASNVVLDESGSSFDVTISGKKLGRIHLPLAGRHNVLNSLAATAVGLHLDVPFATIAEALAGFEGVGRRIELKGEADGVTVVDDYGHHPTEIRATIAGVRGRWPRRRLVVLFQPHRFTRTQLLADKFGMMLRAADRVLLMPIYPAGEKPIRGVSSDLIARRIDKKKLVRWDWSDGIEALRAQLKPGDVLLTLGAGDVYKAGEHVVKNAGSLAHRLESDIPMLSSRVKPEEPLSRHTTWAIGGPAEAFIELKTLDELKTIHAWCRERDVPLFFLGWGSNILLPDEGLRGVVARLRGDFEKIVIDGTTVRVGAGVHLPRLAKACVEGGLSGVEALAGVPGTVGGALMTNAGTPRGVIGDVLVSADVLDPDGSVVTVPRSKIDISYRHTSLMGRRIIAAELILKTGDDQTKARLKEELDMRARTQPLGTKNAGSVFRNPPNDHAARLIEAAGLKGKGVGKMRFSPKHANFIENTGGGTARETVELIKLAQATVKEKFNVDLVPEVMIVGAASNGTHD